MNRTFAVGDIHGAYRSLKQLMGFVQPTQHDTLIFLGDYVDGWSESAQVIDYLLELSNITNCVFIQGNHDTWCAEWLDGSLSKEEWITSEGSATVDSYHGMGSDQVLKHKEFYRQMKMYWVDDRNRLFIHAGYASMHGPSRETYTSNYSWDRTLWEMALALDPTIPKDSVFYPKRLKLFEEIYIGHTPTTNYGVKTPMNKANVWNMDTGAAFKGCISAMEIHTKKVFQSEPAYLLYPNENGRNT